MRTKLGAPKAITATAHKLARIIFQILSTRQPYDESVFAKSEQVARQRLEAKLKPKPWRWDSNWFPQYRTRREDLFLRR